MARLPIQRTGDAPPVEIAMVRQHTPLNLAIHERDQVISVQIAGERSVVLIGMTAAGAELLASEITRAATELHWIKHRAEVRHA